MSLSLFSLFLLFTYLVYKEKLTVIDPGITTRLQSHIPRKFDFIFSLFSVLGSVEITGLIWLATLTFLVFKKLWQTAASLFLLPLALVIEILGKLFLNHLAPPHSLYRGVIHLSLPSAFIPVEYSYPSGHLIRTAFLVTFFCVFLFLRNSTRFLATVPLLLAFLLIMFVSRIYLGEHWFSDVYGGTLIGVSFGLLSAMFIPRRPAKNFGRP